MALHLYVMAILSWASSEIHHGLLQPVAMKKPTMIWPKRRRSIGTKKLEILHTNTAIVPTCFLVGLVGDHAHTPPVHPPEPHNDVSGVVRHDLKKVALVYDGGDHIQDVVGLVRRVRHDVVQA